MNKKIKIVLISHGLVHIPVRKRWEILAEKYNAEVHILIPKMWYSVWLRDKKVFITKPEWRDKYFVHPINTTSKSNWSRYLFYSIDLKFRKIKPDFIYVMHNEFTFIHMQVVLARKLWSPKAKMAFFTMAGKKLEVNNWKQRLWLKIINHSYDMAFCHYPGGVEVLKDWGFSKPVYIQTQVGVNDELFSFNAKKRNDLRTRYNVNNSFVIGYAGRITFDKGIDVLLSALSEIKGDWFLVLIGNGEKMEYVKKIIKEKSWENRVLLTGSVSVVEVSDFMQMLDCFFIGSRTREDWFDTFPNTLAQAMGCRIAVVGSDSGALPYMIGDSGIIVPEGKIDKARDAIIRYKNDINYRNENAVKGEARCRKLFGSESLADEFFKIIKKIL